MKSKTELRTKLKRVLAVNKILLSVLAGIMTLTMFGLRSAISDSDKETSSPTEDIYKVCNNGYVAYCIATESEHFNLDPYKMAAIAWAESEYSPGAINEYTHVEGGTTNKRYVRGLFQLCLYTAREMCWRYGDNWLDQYIWYWHGHLYQVHLNSYLACRYVRHMIDNTKCKDEFDVYRYYYRGTSATKEIPRALNHYDKYYAKYE